MRDSEDIVNVEDIILPILHHIQKYILSLVKNVRKTIMFQFPKSSLLLRSCGLPSCYTKKAKKHETTSPSPLSSSASSLCCNHTFSMMKNHSLPRTEQHFTCSPTFWNVKSSQTRCTASARETEADTHFARVY